MLVRTVYICTLLLTELCGAGLYCLYMYIVVERAVWCWFVLFIDVHCWGQSCAALICTVYICTLLLIELCGADLYCLYMYIVVDRAVWC